MAAAGRAKEHPIDVTTDSHDARCTSTLEEALARAPFYGRWREADPGGSVPLARRLAALPVLSKRDARAHVPDGFALDPFAVDAPAPGADALARLLCDRFQVLVSGGYHCAHILHHRLGREGTVRASTQVFNTHADIDTLLDGLRALLHRG
jgi:hypothetical protein